MHIKTWHVEVFIDEDDDTTSARAVLHGSSPRHPEGVGHTRRSPDDAVIPEIGDEVAAARALHHLADALLMLLPRTSRRSSTVWCTSRTTTRL